MKVFIKSNQITIRDRENIDIFYGVRAKYKNLDNEHLNINLILKIINFWKKIILEGAIKNNDLIRKIRFVKGEFQVNDNLHIFLCVIASIKI